MLTYDLGIDFIFGNSLLGAVKLSKNANPGKYSYSWYGIGFDAPSSFLLSVGGGFGKKVIIFAVENSSSAHADNRKKYIFILCKSMVKN